MAVLHHWFSYVCGQENCWYVAGQSLPMCQRCTGLYVGVACALACWAIFRPKPTSHVLWAHGAFLLAMVPFGYHLAPQNSDIRTVTGWFFAFGLVYYMAVFVAPIRESISVSTSTAAVEWNSFKYFGALIAGLSVLLIAVRVGQAWTAWVLSVLGAAGLLALSVLAALTLAVVVRNAARRFLRA